MEHRQQPPPPPTKIPPLQSDIVTDSFVSLLSPFIDPKGTLVQGGYLLLRKLVTGFLAAAYVFLVLTTLMLASVIIGVGLVNRYVEEPIYLPQRLHFDYTDAHPTAVFDFGNQLRTSGAGVPVGQTLYARLVLVMPESDYNIEIGMFQVTAELVSTDGEILATSSHPCMLRFRSLPIRMVQTFIMGVPLTLGITSEIQKLTLTIMKHKEQPYPRSQSIRVHLVPRANFGFLPQLYEAELLVYSVLPWGKGIVRSWKWTLYVWASIYVHLMLVIISLCCFRSMIFVTIGKSFSDRDPGVVRGGVVEAGTGGDRDVSEEMKRWRRERNKRKAMFMHDSMVESTQDSASSSITLNREDISMGSEEVGDSESIFQ